MNEKKVFVHSSAEVDLNAIIGDGTKIWMNSQVKENCEISSNNINA